MPLTKSSWKIEKSRKLNPTWTFSVLLNRKVSAVPSYIRGKKKSIMIASSCAGIWLRRLKYEFVGLSNVLLGPVSQKS